MKVLLTGANGLLGQNVCRQLIKEGHDVVALVRKRASLNTDDMGTRGQRVSIVEGSFTEADVLRAAAQGCEAIINVAGTTDMSLLKYGDYLPVNKEGVEVILEVMHECGIGRLVHVSTANTIGYGTIDQLADEQCEMQQPFRASFYARSKAEGEQLLRWECTQHPDEHIVIVNPGFMIGPFDTKPSSGALLDAAYRKRWMICPSGGKSFIHVRDAAVAIVNALTQGQSGENYLLTGENMSIYDFYTIQSKVCGYKQHLYVLPDTLLLLAGWVGDLLQMLKIRTQLCSRNVRQLMVMEYYSNRKAVEDLGLPSTKIEQAIEDYYSWKEHLTRKSL